MTTETPQVRTGLLVHNPRWTREARWHSVAQEIARDIFELPDILKNHGIDNAEWHEMERSEGWQAMLREAKALWRSSPNTRERIEAKTLYMIEQSLEEMYRAMHDGEFSHSAKVELFKTFARNVGIGVKDAVGVAAGERVQIVINMGDKKLEQDVTPRVIEGEAIEIRHE